MLFLLLLIENSTTDYRLQCYRAKTHENANGHFEGPIDFFDQSFYKLIKLVRCHLIILTVWAPYGYMLKIYICLGYGNIPVNLDGAPRWNGKNIVKEIGIVGAHTRSGQHTRRRRWRTGRDLAGGTDKTGE